MTEREKMLAGELYDPFDPELVAGRERARDLCQALNATRESHQEERRRILTGLFATGGDSVWIPAPVFGGGKLLSRDSTVRGGRITRVNGARGPAPLHRRR